MLDGLLALCQSLPVLRRQPTSPTRNPRTTTTDTTSTHSHTRSAAVPSGAPPCSRRPAVGAAPGAAADQCGDREGQPQRRGHLVPYGAGQPEGGAPGAAREPPAQQQVRGAAAPRGPAALCRGQGSALPARQLPARLVLCRAASLPSAGHAFRQPLLVGHAACRPVRLLASRCCQRRCRIPAGRRRPSHCASKCWMRRRQQQQLSCGQRHRRQLCRRLRHRRQRPWR